jgi:hypothetical protein
MKNTKTSETDTFWGTLRQELTGKPAQNGKVSQVLFGRVTQFNPERKFGIAVVNSKRGGMKQSFSIFSNTGPFLIGIKKSSSSPEFVRLSDAYPPNGAEIVLEVSGVNGDMHVVRWGCAQSYQDAEKAIASRPTFRLMYRKGDTKEELARGSALEINQKFPHVENDPLYARELKDGGYLYWLRRDRAVITKGVTIGGLCWLFQKPATVISKEIVWTETGDPRPMQVSIQDKQPAPIVAPAVSKSDLNSGFSKRFYSLEELALA